eukprot:5817831-Prymnesium_polylepis.1
MVAEGGTHTRRDAHAGTHTPRYEPSWFFEEVDHALVEQCCRPRRRQPLDAESRDWLHKQLVACGHEANARSHHAMAHAWFECAFLAK